MFTCYILFSRRTSRYYVGSTQDMANRLQEHNSGEGHATRSGAPWVIVWKEEFLTRREALVRERQIKARGIRRFLEDQRKKEPG